MGSGNFEGAKGRPIVKYRDTLQSPVWKRLNPSWCHLDRMAQEIMNEMGVQIPSWEGAVLGKGLPIVKYRTFCRELCRNGWTSWFTIWVMASGGPKEAWVQSYLPGGTIVPDDTLLGAVQKWLNQSICHLACGLRWAEGSTSSINDIRQVVPPRQCAHMGGHIGATRRIRPQRRCSLMSNYSDYLLTHHIKLIKLSALCHFTDYLPLKVFDILSMLFLQYIYFLTIMVTLFISILQCLLIVFNTCLKIWEHKKMNL